MGCKLLRRILHYEVALCAFDANLMGVVIYDDAPVAKIVPGWRRRNAPLQRSAIPGILRSRRAAEATVDQVIKKNKLARAGYEGGDGDELVHRHQRSHEVIDE